MTTFISWFASIKYCNLPSKIQNIDPVTKHPTEQEQTESSVRFVHVNER